MVRSWATDVMVMCWDCVTTRPWKACLLVRRPVYWSEPDTCLLVNSKIAWKDHEQAKTSKDLDVKVSKRGTYDISIGEKKDQDLNVHIYIYGPHCVTIVK